MSKKDVVIAGIDDKYDSPIAELVNIACKFTSRVKLIDDSHDINCKSIMGVMALNPCKGKAITISAEGEDEVQALEAMEAFLLCK